MSYNRKLQRNFTDKNSISDHLLCPICLDVFDSPLRAPCGHTYCCLCIYQWIDANKVCPVCKKKIKSGKYLDTDLVPKKIISDLEVKCVSNNCQWKGRNEELRKHYIGCKFREVEKQEVCHWHDVIEIPEDAKDQKEIIDLGD